MNNFKYLAISLAALREPALNWQEFCRLIREVGCFTEFLESLRACEATAEFAIKASLPGVLERHQHSIAAWIERGLVPICLADGRYPPLLKEIYDPPRLLFLKGASPETRPEFLAGKPCVAIVGARDCDARGQRFARELAAGLAQSGACVISGLAYGIDAAGHWGAIESGEMGATCAVLGHGLNHIYPASHRALSEKIVETGGFLISQFEPEVRPFPSNFLARNRIIAGICRAVLVVQASARSGALVTARFAVEEGREVMAVPGDLSDSRYAGSNKLIQRGAHLITCIEDVFEIVPEIKPAAALTKERKENGKSKALQLSGVKLDTMSIAVMNFISAHGTQHYDSVLKALPCAEASSIAQAIVNLEIEGLIVRLPGNFLSKSLNSGRS